MDESRKTSDKKYYEKKKREKHEKEREEHEEHEKHEKEREEHEKEREIKINNNNIECTTIENPEIILNVESEDWSTWLYDTTIGSIKMIAQTFIQTGATILVPAILMWIMPRQPSTQTPLITSSGSVLKPQERDTQPPPNLLNLSQLI